MKNRKWIPLLALLSGLVCAGLRWLLFRNHTDARGLLETGTLVETGIFLLTGLCLVLFALAARRGWAGENKLAAPGQMLGGLGIFLTALGSSGQMAGPVGTLWKIMGLVAGICLIVQGVCTLKKRKVPFLLPLAVCVFFLLHLIDNYRGWSSQPQLQKYLFDLLGILSLTFFSYCDAARRVSLGKPRTRIFSGLCAVYFCLAAIPGTPEFTVLYALCALWALTDGE